MSSFSGTCSSVVRTQMALDCPKRCHLKGKDVNKVHGFNVIDQRYEESGTRFVEMGREWGGR